MRMRRNLSLPCWGDQSGQKFRNTDRNYYSKNCAETVFRKVYREYHEFLYKNRLIDFDDMLVYTKELLSSARYHLRRGRINTAIF